MKTLVILPDAWKTYAEEKPPLDKPVLLKLSNGRIVLAQYGDNGGGCFAWWCVSPTGPNGEWFRSATQAYLAKDATWQPCSLFE